MHDSSIIAVNFHGQRMTINQKHSQHANTMAGHTEKKDFGQAWRQIQGQCFVNLSENIGERQTKHDKT